MYAEKTMYPHPVHADHQHDHRASQGHWRIKSILDNLFAYVVLLDTKGIVEDVNRAPLERGGYRREDVIGCYFPEAPWWSHRDQVQAQLIADLDQARKGESARYEVDMQMGEDLITIDFQLSPVFDDQGEIAGLLATGVEITARKEAETEQHRHHRRLEEMVEAKTAELREANQKLSDTLFALESVGTAITWVEIETGRMLYANRHAAAMLGYTQTEMLGLSVPDIDPNFSLESYSRTVESIHGMTFMRFDTTQRHKDGHLIPVEMTVYYLAGDAESPDRLIAFGIDITARKQAELNLRESEQRLRELSADLERRVEERTAEVRAATVAIREREESLKFVLEGSRLGTWDWNIETGEIKHNDYWAEMLGYRPAELADATANWWLDLIHPDERDLVRHSIEDNLAGRRTLHAVEYRMQTRHGGYRWIMDRARIVGWDRTGRPVRMSGTHEDITGRKAAEEKLRISEDRYRLAMDATSEGLWDIDVTTGRVVVNDQWFAILGYAPGEVVPTFELWKHHLHPDDAAMIFQAHDDYLSGRSPTYDIEHRIITRSGEVRWMRSSGKLVASAADGSPLRLVGTCSDITDRMREKNQIRETLNVLKLATEAADIGIWSWDIRSGRLEWDARICDWYELSEDRRQSALDYNTWKSSVHPEDINRAEVKLMEAVREKAPFEDVFRIMLPGNRVRYMHAASVIELDPSGRPLRMLGVNRDVTAQREQEEMLNAAKLAAESATAAKSQFLAHMSHEIRTPLNGVLGLTQVLERGSLAPEQRDMVRQIGTAGQSLLGILNDILDLSKIEAGQLCLEDRPFALAPLLAQIESLLGPAARGKGVALHIATPAGWAEGLRGDPRRLEQVLVNLIGNAIKFTDRGEIGVRVAILAEAAGTIRLRFEISDTGIGIAPEVLSGLFSPFTQADDSITRRFGGTGLGLSICKHLVQVMGGEIGSTSRLGEGSTFWFELPFVRVPAGELEVTPALPLDECPATPPGSRLAGLHFLVADDSRLNLEVVSQMLSLEGALVTLAVDGQQALDRLRVTPQGFDAVLMDVQMPVMDGLTATRAIRGELGLTKLPVIALTAGVLPGQQAAACAAGVSEVLAKPLDLERLTQRLGDWVKPRPVAASPVVPPSTANGPGRGEAIPDIAGIDRARAAGTLGRDRALFLHVLERFVEEHADTVGQTQRDLERGERGTAERRMHSLRGTAGYLGALDLMASAAVLEEAIAAGETGLAGPLAVLGAQMTALIAASTPWRMPAAVTRAGSDGESSAPPPPLLDQTQVQALHRALQAQNVRARRLFRELEPALAAVLDSEAVQSLGRAIREFRFSEALAVLERSVPGG